jgi:hypothetical protein
MLYVIEIKTVARLTVDVADRKEAEVKAAALEKESNANHHHGEKATAVVIGSAAGVKRTDEHAAACDGCCPCCLEGHCPEEDGTSCGGNPR